MPEDRPTPALRLVGDGQLSARPDAQPRADQLDALYEQVQSFYSANQMWEAAKLCVQAIEILERKPRTDQVHNDLWTFADYLGIVSIPPAPGGHQVKRQELRQEQRAQIFPVMERAHARLAGIHYSELSLSMISQHVEGLRELLGTAAPGQDPQPT